MVAVAVAVVMVAVVAAVAAVTAAAPPLTPLTTPTAPPNPKPNPRHIPGPQGGPQIYKIPKNPGGGLYLLRGGAVNNLVLSFYIYIGDSLHMATLSVSVPLDRGHVTWGTP